MTPLWVEVHEGGENALAGWATRFRPLPADWARLDYCLCLLRFRPLARLIDCGMVRTTPNENIYQVPLGDTVLLFRADSTAKGEEFTLLAFHEEAAFGLAGEHPDAACAAANAPGNSKRRKPYEELRQTID